MLVRVIRAREEQKPAARRGAWLEDGGAPLALGLALGGAVALASAAGWAGAALLSSAERLATDASLVLVTADRPGRLAPAGRLLDSSAATMSTHRVAAEDVARAAAAGADLTPDVADAPVLEARVKPGPEHERLVAALRRLRGVRVEDAATTAPDLSRSIGALRRLGVVMWVAGVVGGTAVAVAATRLAVAAQAGTAALLLRLGAPVAQSARIARQPLARAGAIGAAAGCGLSLVMALAARGWLVDLGIGGGERWWTAALAAPLLVSAGAAAGLRRPKRSAP